MTRLNRFQLLLGSLWPLLCWPLSLPAATRDRPNVIIILADDLGYADVGVFGAKGFKTPNLDRMAREGIRFTDFYVAQPVCSASRAALMTGCYANRIGIHGALGPTARHGIHSNELTMAEMFKARGYATAIWQMALGPPRAVPAQETRLR